MKAKLVTILASSLTAGFLAQGCSSGGGPSAPPKPIVSALSVKATYTSNIRVGDPLPLPTTRTMESVQIVPAPNEAGVTDYNIYWANGSKNKTGSLIAKIPAKGDGQLIDYEFADNVNAPFNARYLLVCTANGTSEFCAKANNLDYFHDDVLKAASNAKVLTDAVKANSDQTCPGLEVMATCGDLQCDADAGETAQTCFADCGDYAVTAFNFQNYCDEVQQVFHPESIAEMQAIIAQANANNKRVKVTAAAGNQGTTGSATGIVCTDGYLIITDKIDENNSNFTLALETFEGKEVVNAPAGIRMHDLGEWLYQRGKQMGFVHLGWRDATLAGAIGTSAHGSSPKNTNIVAHKVVSMDIINPQGELKTYSRGTTGVTQPDVWQAMTTHLGYMGIIVGVRVEVEEAQNVHVRVTFHDEDELFNDPSKSVYEDIKDCDYGQYNWFPTLGSYARWCGNVSDKPADLGANNSLLNPYGATGESDFQPTAAEIFQGFHVGACFPETDIVKTGGALRADSLHMAPPLIKTVDGTDYYTSEATGPLHRMTSGHLVEIGREVFQMDWEIAIPAKHLEAALNLVNDFAHGMNEKNREMPMPLVGVFVRFSVVDDKSLLAYTGAGGDFNVGDAVVHIEMPIPVPINFDDARFNEYLSAYETVNKRLISEFGGRAHWGKNQYYHNGKSHPVLFELQRDIGTYGDRLTRFNNAISIFDPNGMFANRQGKAIGVEYPNFTYPANW